ncbi:MAG: type II secretion system F family protein [Kiritimatiellia bacterium]
MNTVELMYIVGMGLMWALFAGGLGWYLAVMARQITYVTLADGRRQERTLPMLFRMLLPLAPNFTPLFEKPEFERIRTRAGRRLTAAGFDALLGAEEYLALRVLCPLVMGLLIWCPLIWILETTSPGSFVDRYSLLLYALGLLLSVTYPASWLKRVLTARHKNIQRALPFVLDLLTLSVEAGLDFMTAMQRCVERRKVDPLGEELIRVIREIQLGKTRREALRDLAGRVDLSELRSTVNALIQADELGVSIASMLRIQADQMRQRRFERAEKLANEAPVKMLFPLVVFIFPAVFLILLGPILNRLLQQGI